MFPNVENMRQEWLQGESLTLPMTWINQRFEMTAVGIRLAGFEISRGNEH
jgi:hypothetical protein